MHSDSRPVISWSSIPMCSCPIEEGIEEVPKEASSPSAGNDKMKPISCIEKPCICLDSQGNRSHVWSLKTITWLARSSLWGWSCPALFDEYVQPAKWRSPFNVAPKAPAQLPSGRGHATCEKSPVLCKTQWPHHSSCILYMFNNVQRRCALVSTFNKPFPPGHPHLFTAALQQQTHHNAAQPAFCLPRVIYYTLPAPSFSTNYKVPKGCWLHIDVFINTGT